MTQKKDSRYTRKTADWLKILVLFLDDIGAIILIALVLWYFRVRIPWPITVALLAVVLVIVVLTNLAVIPTLSKRATTGAEGMVGERGKVATTLSPEGTIAVEGEHWQAKSLEGTIPAGETVEIVSVALDGLTLKVKRAKQI